MLGLTLILAFVGFGLIGIFRSSVNDAKWAYIGIAMILALMLMLVHTFHPEALTWPL